jgi:flavin reductase (DIM6/NTAB) family NADH-FMN oxidoreductase RutF
MARCRSRWQSDRVPADDPVEGPAPEARLRSRLELDPVELGPGRTYRWLTSVIVPRPIAWVSSTSADGVDNLAPHSFFTVASDDPPVVQFTSIGSKDSLRNVRETGEFVVNITTETLTELVNASGTDYPPELGEFDELSIAREPSVRVRPPRVAEAPVALECTSAGFHEFGHATVVFGRVVHLAVAESVVRDGRARIELLRPMARLGGNEWSAIGEVSSRPRTPYADLQLRTSDSPVDS